VKLLLSPLAFLVLCALFFVTPASAWEIKAMNSHIDQTNFLVNKGCSGTLIDMTQRLILTANHCVADQYEVIEKETISDDGVVKKEKVRRLRDGTVSQFEFDAGDPIRTVTYKVKVMAVDAKRDLALLQIKAKLPEREAAVLACDTPIRGATAFVVGNPTGVLYSSVVKGIVSSIDRDYDMLSFGDSEQAKQPLMQISAGIIGGNSGGAVYNEAGELVGVPVLGHRANEILGFAVPLDEIKAFLKESKVEDIPALTRCKK
jgi:S1-C subfamily serine protease